MERRISFGWHSPQTRNCPCPPVDVTICLIFPADCYCGSYSGTSRADTTGETSFRRFLDNEGCNGKRRDSTETVITGNPHWGGKPSRTDVARMGALHSCGDRRIGDGNAASWRFRRVPARIVRDDRGGRIREPGEKLLSSGGHRGDERRPESLAGNSYCVQDILQDFTCHTLEYLGKRKTPGG